MTGLDRWQRPEDGFPSDAYFAAVADAIQTAEITLEGWDREEDWEVNYTISWNSYKDGPLSWARHGLFISWRCDESDAPQHPDDFTGLGWYWVPYSKPDTALGDYAREFALPYLAEPQQVAREVAELIKPHQASGPFGGGDHA